MKTAPFIGRETELERLKGLFLRLSASLVVVRGRRRIGKSRLLAELGKDVRSLFFSGMPPSPKTTSKSQKQEFAYQLERAGLPGVKADDWGNLFWHLSNQTNEGKVLVVFDEISWMGGKDPDFLGKLKTAWDMHFSRNPNLVLVLCGSISSWIEENILSSTGFLGRISLDMVLEELPIKACNDFWGTKSQRISAFEKFKLLSVTGGVPLYLEQIRPDLSAEQNILELCFTRGGLLVREFDEIFSDLFSKSNATHKDIVACLSGGPKTLKQICSELGKSLGGTYSKHLDELIKAGFIKRDFTWSIKDGHESKLSRYRLSDNYLRFYLKYIEPNRAKIDKDAFSGSNISRLPGWESLMGFQFENLVAHNRKLIWELMNVAPEEVLMDGPFYQTQTARQKGCQIDYMVQTRFQTLYICEVKFHKNPIGTKIVQEMKEKLERLSTPRFCSIRPVLIHINGVDEAVKDLEYFDKIVDFSLLLDS